jgi:hypothetical protein
MLFGIYLLLLAGAGLAAPSPAKLISTTEVSAIRLGHAAANVGAPIGPGTKPARMRHICKNMQKAVQNTYTRLLTIIGISGPLPSDGKNVPEGRFSRIQVTYHKFIPVPVVAALGAADSQDGGHPDGTMVHRQGGYRYHKDGQYRGPFLRRVHRALMMLGPWEGRIVAFVLGCGIGVLLRMFWVMAVLFVRGTRGEPEHEEAILVCAEEVVPIYSEIDEKKQVNDENGD